MKNLLLIFLFFLAACGQKKADQHHADASPGSTTNKASDDLKMEISKKFVTGRFDFKTRDDFVRVDPQDADKEVYLQKKTYKAFKAMADSAEKDGITFTIVSGTRNFAYQKSIWDHKWQTFKAPSDLKKALEILEFSSMPMTSRHHWGTDLDLNNLNNNYFAKGKGKKEYEWLKRNANHFGFYQPYTDKSLHNRTGYEEEKWHWSYMPLAGKYLAFYNKHVTNKDISGFEGSNLAGKIDMVGKYVDGVSEKIKKYGK